jgi:hypothetical protein
LADAAEDIDPRLLEKVAFTDGNVEQRLDGLDVLRLHLTEVIEERKLGEC